METNKEVIDALQEYFLKQDRKKIARALANCMIDIQRFVNFDSLPEHEASLLITRAVANSKEIIDFVKEKKHHVLKLWEVSSDD